MAKKKKGKNGHVYCGNWKNCTNLRFLVDFFGAAGLTPASFSRLTANPNSTASALRRQLSPDVDDMQLSKAESIIESIGYKLEVSFHSETMSEMTTITHGDGDYIVDLPSMINTYTSKYPRLGFLKCFMARRHITMSALAERIGMGPGAIHNWFQADDIRISHLIAIQQAYKLQINFTIKRNTNN